MVLLVSRSPGHACLQLSNLHVSQELLEAAQATCMVLVAIDESVSACSSTSSISVNSWMTMMVMGMRVAVINPPKRERCVPCYRCSIKSLPSDHLLTCIFGAYTQLLSMKNALPRNAADTTQKQMLPSFTAWHHSSGHADVSSQLFCPPPPGKHGRCTGSLRQDRFNFQQPCFPGCSAVWAA